MQCLTPSTIAKLRPHEIRAAFAHWRRRHRWAALELSSDNLSRLGFTVRECTSSADPAVRARVRARNEELRLLQGTGAALPVVQHSAPRQTAARPRGAGRPARRRAGSSSRTSSCDPGDDGEPEPPSPRLYLVRTTPPRATLSYGRVTAAQRGADAEPVAS